MKNGKAPGPDGIPPETIKADTETSVDCLYWLFGKIWVEEEIPEDWRHGHLFKLPNKNNLKHCKNWRGSTLLSTIEGCQRGIQWTLSKQLEDTDFADNVALLSHRHDNKQDKATSLYESAAKLGLNIKKTRTMRANHVNKNSIQLRGEDIVDG